MDIYLDPDKPFNKMSDKEIIENFKKMAGIYTNYFFLEFIFHLLDPKTREIYDYPSVVEMIIPTLRADSKVGSELLPLTTIDIPIIVYGGDKEENVKEPFLKRFLFYFKIIKIFFLF